VSLARRSAHAGGDVLMALFDRLTPELLQKGLMGLGIAAGQLKNVDEATKKALGRFFMAAVASGDVNGYVRERLQWLEERDREPVRPASSVRVTSRVVTPEGEFDDGPEPARKGRK
jgi:hypothetical protein